MTNILAGLPEKELFRCETRRGFRKLLCLLAIFILVALSFASWYLYDITHVPIFVPPEFEANVKSGTPENVKDDTGFEYLKIDTDFEIGVCGKPYIQNDQLYLYFTNPSSNHYWVLVLLINSKGAEVGRSGVIKPGEYIQAVNFNDEQTIDDVNSLLIKIITYEPETYESRGTFTLNPQILDLGYKSE